MEAAEQNVLGPALIATQAAPILASISTNANPEEIREWAKKQVKAALERMRTQQNPRAPVQFAMRKFGVSSPLNLSGVLSAVRSTKAPQSQWQSLAWQAALDRVLEHGWWVKAARKSMRRAREAIWISLAPEQVQGISPDAVAESREQDQTDTAWAFQHIAVRESDEAKAPLPSPEDRRRHQYAEILATAKGLGALADETGCTPRMITVTCPSEAHPTTTVAGRRRPNPSYNGASPREALDWLTERWKRFRAALKRKAIATHWLRATEPHEDETPHYHLIMWAPENQWGRIEALFRRYFEADTSASPARQKHGLEIKPVEGGTHGAIAYIASYIAKGTKGIDGEAGEADRIRAWRQVWGVRGFDFSHRKATIWRLLRKMEPLAGVGQAAQTAAKSGDFANFLKKTYTVGLQIYREEILGRELEHGFTEINHRVRGVVDKYGVLTLTTKWRLERKPQLNEGKAPFRRSFSLTDFFRMKTKSNINNNLFHFCVQLFYKNQETVMWCWRTGSDNRICLPNNPLRVACQPRAPPNCTRIQYSNFRVPARHRTDDPGIYA